VFEHHEKWEKIAAFEKLIDIAERAAIAYDPGRKGPIMSERRKRIGKLRKSLKAKAPPSTSTGVGPLRLNRELVV